MKRKIKMNLALLLVMAISTSPILYAAEPSGAQCDRVQTQMVEWAKQNPAPTLAEFRQLSEGEQKGAFRNLDSQAKVNLWQEKFQEVFQTYSLNADQAALLGRLQSLVTPVLYEFSEEGLKQRRQVEEFQSLLEEVFTKRDLRNIVATLNPVYESIPDELAGNEHLAPVNPPPPSTIVVEKCNCHVTSDWCSFGQKCMGMCHTDDPGWSSIGCGTLWIFDCTGHCRPTVEPNHLFSVS